jgi:peptidoglycan/xylan/chitin deacetylase (PgdA/CDA1 family)
MSGNKPIVLLYHQVSSKNTKFIENYNINVNPKLFDNHMKILKNNFSTITFKEWGEAIKNNEDVSNKILVTFDDAYSDAVNYGGEILNKYDLDGIWFVNGGMINNDKMFWLSKLMYLYDNGKLNDFVNKFNVKFSGLLKNVNLDKLKVKDIDSWAKDNYSKELSVSLEKYISYFLDENYEASENSIYASADEIKKLSKNFIIGNHTLNHPNFRNLSIEDKVKESEKSKVIIENIINKKINTFAFPFGQEHLHWCQNDVSIIKNLGYDFIFSVVNKSKRVNKDVIHRHEIVELSGSEFKSFVNGLVV